MSVARLGGKATLLLSGEVLVAGGIDQSRFFSTGSADPVGSAELYDPANGSFTLIEMTVPRACLTATRLSDGRVLLAGGDSGSQQNPSTTSTAELYDPSTGAFTSTGQMTTGRASQTATLLANGRVLVVGGEDLRGGILSTLSSTEIYDPATGTFTAGASMAAP
jgi:hypothetical protein